MIIGLLLAGYAATLATLGPLVLRRSWTQRSPRLGIIAWQSISTATVIGAALAALGLALAEVPLTTDLDHLIMACAQVFRGQSSFADTLAAATGSLVFATVLSRAVYQVVRALVGAARYRARHRSLLGIAATPRAGLDAVVLDCAEPALYCVPGRGERIVVTTAALSLLGDEQLAAAFAHERAHLRQRHDVVIAYALGLARAFPRVRVFREALTETTRLVELLADDVAARSTDRLTLAGALLALSGAQPPPVAGLGATGAGAARVERLIAPPRPLGRARSIATSLLAAALFAAPLGSVAGAGSAIGLGQQCPPAARASVRIGPVDATVPLR